MKFLLLIIFSGFISVDRNSALNIMISRPIVISTIIGILFGNPTLCFIAGLLFEIIGLVDVPVGTHIPRDDSFATYTFALLIALGLINNTTDMLISLLLITLFIYPVTFSEKIIRKFNKLLYLKEKKNHYNIRTKPLIIRGIAFSFLRGTIVYNLFFLITAFLLIQLKTNVLQDYNYQKYIFLIIVFLFGYILRFLTFKSIYKYIIFFAGLFIGWLV